MVYNFRMSTKPSTPLLESLAETVASCLDAPSLQAMAQLELDPRTRQRLDERCAALADQLWRGGVWSERLDDVALAGLLHACWSAWRHGINDGRADRFARDLGAYVGATTHRRL